MRQLARIGTCLLHVIWRTSLDALRRHAVFCVLVGFLATYTAKSLWWGDFFNPYRHPGLPNVPFLDYLAADLVVFGLLIFLLVLLENLLPWWPTRVVTITASLLIVALSLVNAFWLANTGLQITGSVLRAGVTRFDDAMPIIVQSMQVWGAVLLLGALAAVVGLPFLFRVRWRREEPHAGIHRWYGAALGLLLLLLGGLGLALQGKPRISGWRLVAANLFVSLYHDLSDPLLQEPTGSLPQAPPPPVVSQVTSSRPNVVIVMLEAVSYRASSFGNVSADRTPFLRQLASRGLSTLNMRSVMPHTSKSLFSFLCGRYPAMQNAVIEVADNYGMQCLPHLLRARGYATAFMQSADGTFEDRPRLVANMGFEHFLAWPHIVPPTPQLGYLASDDRALVAPVFAWIQQQRTPFFLTMVTSVTHHNYDPPRGHPDSARVRTLSKIDRYHWLVRYLDAVLAMVFDGLARTGRLDNTIVMVFGDHGEGFGEHGLYQHDNTFFEEGLRVPLVIHAPRQITKPTVVREDRSLLDVPPTLLDLLGIDNAPPTFDGHSLLRATPKAPRYFACWYDNMCVGYVQNHHKYIFLPSARSWVHYDLAADPTESKPRIEAAGDKMVADHLRRWLARHRYSTRRARLTNRKLYGGWDCRTNDECRTVPVAR